MKNKSLFLTVAVCTTIAAGGAIFSQAPTVIYESAPVVNISRRHGNLQAAQKYIVQAFQRVDRAQRANQGQLAGHAQKAKEFLIAADAELKLAAEVSNAEGR